VARILLVGVDLFFRGKLEGLLPGHHLSASDGADPPDLVIADIARVDPQEVADSWPDVPILGYANHTDTTGGERGRLRPGDRQERPGRAGTRTGCRSNPLRSRAMTYVIAEPCIDIKDRSCIDVCPVDCIHETERMLVIDPEECIDCGACEPECPVEAIFPEDALPDKWEPFVKINAVWTDSEATVNELVTAYATEHNVQNEPLD
jgi:NAD-dependent dihydropyrimidine dehydrogenase PreA subunit